MIATDTALEISVQKVAKSRLPEVDFNNLPFGKIMTDHMFVADYDGQEWVDLRVVPFGNMSISPANLTLHYGQTIFEGLKAFKTKSGQVQVFRPEQNSRRLNKSAIRMYMPEVPEEIFLGGLKELLAVDSNWVPSVQGSSLYIRPLLFATDEIVGLQPSQTYRFIIMCCPVGAYYNKPVKVKVETHFTRAVEGGIGYAKTAGNYAAAMLPTQLAIEEGFDQLIWTDGKEHKYVEEAGSMNLMFVINNKLVTASTGDSILDGITRKSVIQLAKEWGMPVEEKKLAITEVIEAAKNGTLQEAFGAGTAATIAQIVQIGYEGIRYDLPAIEKRTFSNKVYQEMEDLKYGRIADARGWMLVI
jgi:branched-chain amino acid aminotransferase